MLSNKLASLLQTHSGPVHSFPRATPVLQRSFAKDFTKKAEALLIALFTACPLSVANLRASISTIAFPSWLINCYYSLIGPMTMLLHQIITAVLSVFILPALVALRGCS